MNYDVIRGGSLLVLEKTGKFVKKGNTGVLYIPAAIVRDSQFPIKEGEVNIRIEYEKIIISP